VDYDRWFLILTYAVFPFWALLIVAPRWRYTQRLVHAASIPLILAAAYLMFAVPGFFPGNTVPGGGFGSLEQVMVLFTSKPAVLAGWVHYLVFDLFIGAWESRDAQRRGIPHWMLIPCLLFTLLLGPVGLALYLVLRFARTRVWSLAETA
jgi:hypothetical protein